MVSRHPAVCWPCPSTFPFNPQSFPLSLSAPACAPYLLHPRYQFLPSFHSSPDSHASPVRGRLDSVTHHGASVRPSVVLLLSSRTLCPSGLVFAEIAPLRDEGRRNVQRKRGGMELRTVEEYRGCLHMKSWSMDNSCCVIKCKRSCTKCVYVQITISLLNWTNQITRF